MQSYKFKSLAIFNALKITIYSYFRSDERMLWLYFFYFSSTYACSHVFLNSNVPVWYLIPGRNSLKKIPEKKNTLYNVLYYESHSMW